MAPVQGAALSGLEAVPLGRSDCHILDVALCTRVRVVLTGEACHKHGSGEERFTYKAMSNFEVLRRFRVCPTTIELAVRRMVAQLVHHSHVVALIWVKAKFEQQDTLESMGFLTAGANGMAVQLQHDMDLWRSLRDEEPFFEEWGRHDYSWHALFRDELVEEEFMRLDLQVFRAVYTGSAPHVT